MNYTHYIGIDPGTTTGMVIYDRNRNAIEVIMSGTLLECQYHLQTTHWMNKIKQGEVFVRMEDARLRTWIPKQKTETAERGRREGAGYVKAHCAIWEDFFKIWGMPFELVAPKRNKTKVKADKFKMITGWVGRTNGHERDAAMLCVGF